MEKFGQSIVINKQHASTDIQLTQLNHIKTMGTSTLKELGVRYGRREVLQYVSRQSAPEQSIPYSID